MERTLLVLQFFRGKGIYQGTAEKVKTVAIIRPSSCCCCCCYCCCIMHSSLFFSRLRIAASDLGIARLHYQHEASTWTVDGLISSAEDAKDVTVSQLPKRWLLRQRGVELRQSCQSCVGGTQWEGACGMIGLWMIMDTDRKVYAAW